jgi:hypothetical protein
MRLSRDLRRAASVAATTLGLAALALTPTATAIPPGGVKPQSNGAHVKLDRTTVTQGGRIKVTGTNWKAKGSRVSGRAEVTIKLDDRDILAILPIKGRRFSGYVRIPSPVKPGRHWLRFLAAAPSTSVKSRAFTVRKQR